MIRRDGNGTFYWKIVSIIGGNVCSSICESQTSRTKDLFACTRFFLFFHFVRGVYFRDSEYGGEIYVSSGTRRTMYIFVEGASFRGHDHCSTSITSKWPWQFNLIFLDSFRAREQEMQSNATLCTCFFHEREVSELNFPKWTREARIYWKLVRSPFFHKGTRNVWYESG